MFDIFFISNGTQEADVDFATLKDRCPFARKVTSFEDAKLLSATKMFYAVWPGVIVSSDFNFDYKPDADQYDTIHIWPHKTDDKPPSVCLFPKNKDVTKRELDYRFFVGMIKMNVVASFTKRYDIVFISYEEENAESNYQKLCKHSGTRFNNIMRVKGVKGIAKAHIAAASVATTDMFWVVDGDAIIEDKFDFDLSLSADELDIVHVWPSRNPVNDLMYGHGGVKLLPRERVLNMDENTVDFTTSISDRFKIMPTVSNVEAFNTSPFNAWRTGFRECVKLSSKVIAGQIDEETESRLRTWVRKGGSRKYGEYAKGGASAGEWFGTTYKDNKEMLDKINDYDWLAAEFIQHTQMFPPETFRLDR